MTIDEISKTLPNGFHDSGILNINIDYIKQEVNLLFDVDLTSPYEDVDEARRKGNLKLINFLYFVIEPPVESYSKNYLYSEDILWVASDSSDFSVVETYPVAQKLPYPLPDGSFRHFFYLTSHNCLIYMAAMSADFQWISPWI